ncbi:purine-nucleoside phosphorylase [candidate division KSB1 bacterium]|nr:purine-nucleoside phosphorylase [candidate division KSB1 bacterium]NIR68668.1 purine-nucleoside phosphorylase [candidate division KSB1 bacterium]NIS27157.1 purine-nucleoside phosphorylase [candidate division KSB1 bacterium]NIT74043.1 purine-nucleoside phosphorylase [candidate division KSB1 bacterium]NIU27909.1 purine-nucleoside phosphorylase [candidate division KSB1 bacterium]
MAHLRENIQEAGDFLKQKSQMTPEIGIILGTGLGSLAKEIEKESEVSYEQIPHFPVSTVESHAGRLIFGKIGNKPVMAMQGRFHYYEGYSMKQITFPVRVMKYLGAETLLVSNACGGMNPLFTPGDIMIITDHINLLGDNPLIGVNDDALGPRFPDMSEPYAEELIDLAEQIALEERLRVQKGVYVAVSGPNLETRAEYRFLRAIGADVVGMSTIPEVIVAIHGSMRVLGLSVVTDACFPDALEPVNIQKILKTAAEAEPKLTLLMKRVVERM